MKRLLSKRTGKRAEAVMLSFALVLGSLLSGSFAVKAEENNGVQWLPQEEMSVTSSVATNAGYPVENILDGDPATLWHSEWAGEQAGVTFPADAFTVDLGGVKEGISWVKYTPRQSDINGKVRKYQVFAGEDLADMKLAAGGCWDFSDTDRNDNSEKSAAFKPVNARYITLKVFDATRNAGELIDYLSCAEFNIGVQTDTVSRHEELAALIETAKARLAESKDEEYKSQLEAAIHGAEAQIQEFGILANEDAEKQIACLEKSLAGETEFKTEVVYVPSQVAGYEPEKMLDGNKNTFYESSWESPEVYYKAGDYLVFDLRKVVKDLSQIQYTPRQDNSNGRIMRHRIWVSSEDMEGTAITGTEDFLKEHFTYAGTGVWDNSADDKVSTFDSCDARYVALQVFSTGGDGNTMGCAEISFQKQEGIVCAQGQISELITQLKAMAEASDIPAVSKQVNEKIAETEGERFTLEAVTVIEEELKELIERYSNIGDVKTVKSGRVWVDTEGETIQAHSGNIIYDKNTKTYYWYGDHKGTDNIGGGTVQAVGVACYSSKDLYNWTNEGLVLPVFNNPQLVDGSVPNDDYPMYVSEASEEYQNTPAPEYQAPYDVISRYTTPEFIEKANALYDGLSYAEKQELYRSFNWDKVLERAKVVYNEKTGKYVMWWHQDGPRAGQYYDAMGGVAVSDSPTGPFRFIQTKRLLPENPAATGMLRDMNLFVDDDGTGYLIYASEENATTIIHKLNEEYTDVSGTVEGTDYVRVFAGQYREAPAIFKEGNTYYLVTSAQSGWAPNPCRYAWVENKLLSTEWSENQTFCVNDHDVDGNPVSPDRGTTFFSQSTWILPVRDGNGDPVPGKYVYVGDRWYPNDLKDSRYVWLPMELDNESKTVSMEWKDSWTFEEMVSGGTEEPDTPDKPEEPDTPEEPEGPDKPGEGGTDRPADPGSIEVSDRQEQNAMKGVLPNQAELTAVLDEQDKAAVREGKKIQIEFEAKDISKSISDVEKNLIAKTITAVLKDQYRVGAYLDLSLFKTVEGQERKQIAEASADLTVQFTLPENLLNTTASVSRIYKMIRIHDGKAAVLDAFADGNVLTFKTDRFSTYALVYRDVTKKTEEGQNAGSGNGQTSDGAGMSKAPQSGDTQRILPFVFMMLASAGALSVISLLNRKKVK